MNKEKNLKNERIFKILGKEAINFAKESGYKFKEGKE